MILAANPALAKARKPGKAPAKAKKRSRDSKALETDPGEYSLGICDLICVDSSPGNGGRKYHSDLFVSTLRQSSRATSGQTDICKRCTPHMRMIDTLIALPGSVRLVLDYVQYRLLSHLNCALWTDSRVFTWCVWPQRAWPTLSTLQS